MLIWNVYWQKANGDPEAFDIIIRKPKLSNLIPNTWECSISMPIAWIELKTIYGSTPLQALSLSIGLIHSELESLAERRPIFDVQTNQRIFPEVFATEMKSF